MFNFFKKNKLINKQSLIFLVFLILFAIVFLLTEKYSQSFHFVDEDDHLVFGHYINKGYQLYRDLSSTNHQPLIYLFSSLVQRISKPQTLFELVKRGREGIFFFGFLWGLFLFSEFGFIILPFVLFFELTKFFIFGNLYLGESLIIYPFIFILGETFRVVFLSHRPKKWQTIIFGLANFLIIFTLLPLILSLFIIDLIYIFKTRKIRSFLVALAIPTAILFIIISPFDWFRETIFYNLKYAIPRISVIKSKFDYLNFFIFPLLSFVKADNSIFNQYIQLFSIVLLLNFIFFIILSKVKKEIFYLFLFLLAVLLLNNRVLMPGKMYYEGFHLLPWYAGVIFFDLLMVELLLKRVKNRVKFISLLVLIGGGIFLLLSFHMPYFVKINKNYEHHVNFFPYYLIGKAIKTVSEPTDRLAVFPNESLIYWQSGLKPATRQIVYYDWNYDVPQTKKEMDGVFANNPPEFIYADFKRIGAASYLPILKLTLEKNYWQATSQGIAQNLFIKKEKISEITQKQWQEWTELSFDKIDL